MGPRRGRAWTTRWETAHWPRSISARKGRLRTREDIVAAHAEGTVRRLRPKIMTVATMAAGLLPLLWADGAGAEIMKRVAAPMLGGLVTSAFLTLEVLPVLYTLWRAQQLRRAVREGVPLETVIGMVPTWAAATSQAPVLVPGVASLSLGVDGDDVRLHSVVR